MTHLSTRMAALSAFAISTLVLAGCSAGASSEPTGGTRDARLTIGITGEPANFDFTTTAGAPIPQAMMNNVYEGLVTVDQEGELIPQLAESWTVSDDGLTYDFLLHDGVTFSSGADFTADDVKFSLERVKTDWTLNVAKMEVVDRVEVISPTEARVVLSRPSNTWLFDMASTVGMMFDTDGVADLATTPVGTGPFTVTEFVSGDHLSLAARDDYWGDAPGMEEITIRYFADAVASTNALRAGDVDMLYDMQAPDLVGQFESDDSVQVINGTSTGEIILPMNNQLAPFDDVRVRQAVAYAIDRQALVDTAWAGYGTLIGAMVPPTDPYYEDLNDLYPYDPEKAMELLDEAGVEDLTVQLDVPTRPYATAISEVLVSQLADVGITATINSTEFPAVWLDKVYTKHDFQMSVIRASEARDLLPTFNVPTYYIGYDNTEIAPLVAAADAAPADEWVEDMKEVSRIIAEDVPAVPLFLFPNIVVASADLTGIAGNSVTESMVLSDIVWE